MNCIFDKEKECPLGGKIVLENMGRFCQACVGREEMRKARESMKVLKAGTILSMLRLFPKDEEKAKLEYQKLMKRVEEW